MRGLLSQSTKSFFGTLLKFGVMLVLGKAVQEAHQAGKLEPLLQAGMAHIRLFLSHVSTEVKGRGNRQWKTQAPRVGRFLQKCILKIREAVQNRRPHRTIELFSRFRKHSAKPSPGPSRTATSQDAYRPAHTYQLEQTYHMDQYDNEPSTQSIDDPTYCDLSIPGNSRTHCNVLSGRG